MNGQYCRQIKEIERFQGIVRREGADIFKAILDEAWFAKVKKEGADYYAKSEKERMRGIYFPYSWLWEEGDWRTINAGLKDLTSFTHKQAVLRRIVKRLIHDKWEDGAAAALEISSLIKFLRDGTLVEVEPRINRKSKYRVDALIRIERRNILVEVTTLARPIIDTASLQKSCSSFMIDTRKLVAQVKRKTLRKLHTQLHAAEDPLILIVSLPPHIGADQQTAKWAINELSLVISKISAVVVSDTYRLMHGTAHINGKAEFALTKKETDYISDLLIPTTQLL